MVSPNFRIKVRMFSFPRSTVFFLIAIAGVFSLIFDGCSQPFRGAKLSGADLRGARYSSLDGAVDTSNSIRYDGTIAGLHLNADHPSLTIRNYKGGSQVNTAYTGRIHITGQMNVEAATVLHIILDDNTWNSTISFDSGIPVTLAGTLQVRRAPGANPQSLMGKTIRVFDWTGVTPVGRFQWKDDLPAEYVWDTAKLYTTGEISIRNK